MSHTDPSIPIAFDTILPALGSATASQALHSVAAAAARALDRNEKLLLERLAQKEGFSPSAVGGGVAIPHLRMSGLDRPFLVFARLQNPVDFHAPDSIPVDLVCLVLSPESLGNADHLRRLARVSRLFKDQGLCTRLRTVEDESGVRALLLDTADRAQAA